VGRGGAEPAAAAAFARDAVGRAVALEAATVALALPAAS